MRKAFALLTVFVMLLLCACDAQQPADATTTAPTVETTVDPLLEVKFRDTVNALSTYAKTGALINEDGVDEAAGYSASEIYTIFYDQLLGSAAHPEAEAYLSRFYFMEDVLLTLDVTKTVAGKEEFQTSGSYAYSADGKLTQEPVVNEGGALHLRQYLYQSNRLSSIYDLDKWGTYARTTYNYDDKGNLTLVEYVPTGGTAVRSYYENGLLIREEYRGISGDRDVTYTYENGRLVLEEDTEGNRTEYIYNDAGQCIRRVESGRIWDLSYDEQGNLIRESYTVTNTAMLLTGIVIDYTYDAGRLLSKREVYNYRLGEGSYTEETVTTYTYGDCCIYQE